MSDTLLNGFDYDDSFQTRALKRLDSTPGGGTGRIYVPQRTPHLVTSELLPTAFHPLVILIFFHHA
jgi:hypothetical protein